LCSSTCGACNEVDAIHREHKLAIAKDDEEKKKAEHFSVRGLRRCNNVECAAHLNRDYNAAINIQRRCRSLLASDPDPHPLTAEEEEIVRHRMEIDLPS
jgi:transposase